jgi:multisubunit Na+/H+ antiporter MnhG subunit
VILIRSKAVKKLDKKLITGLFQVIGFVLFVIGLIFVLRAYGMVRKDSPYVRYHKAVGFPLLIVGIVILVVSFIA